MYYQCDVIIDYSVSFRKGKVQGNTVLLDQEEYYVIYASISESSCIFEITAALNSGMLVFPVEQRSNSSANYVRLKETASFRPVAFRSIALQTLSESIARVRSRVIIGQ